MATPTKKPAAAKKPATAKPGAPATEKAAIHKAAAKKDSVAKKPAAAKPATHKAAAHAPTAHTPISHAHKAVEAEENVAVAAAPATEAIVRAPIAILDLKGKYTYSVGRRKTSVANVRLYNGTNPSTVNGKKLADYFSNNAGYLEDALKPLRLTGLEKEVYLVITVNGGGINSQAGAVAHGLSRAIAKANSEFHKVLKQNGLLTRDSRMKERKKPGLKRARRGPQWAKR
jgi:small subunit ribosomal protein S9